MKMIINLLHKQMLYIVGEIHRFNNIEMFSFAKVDTK